MQLIMESNIWETANSNYWVIGKEEGVLSLDLPGFTDIRVLVKNNNLFIMGKRNRFTFDQVFSIPESIDQQTLSARLVDGVLSITGSIVPSKKNSRELVVSRS